MSGLIKCTFLPRRKRISHVDIFFLKAGTLFDKRQGERLTADMMESRQVLSGTQRKLVLRRAPGGWALPLNGAPSTHILKQSSGRYDGLVANEMACPRLLGRLGLEVPEAPPR